MNNHENHIHLGALKKYAGKYPLKLIIICNSDQFDNRIKHIKCLYLIATKFYGLIPKLHNNNHTVKLIKIHIIQYSPFVICFALKCMNLVTPKRGKIYCHTTNKMPSAIHPLLNFWIQFMVAVYQ